MQQHYRADIDGLRAIAVLGVMAFHIDASLLVGGYTGVDVFFVISGFVITQLIVRELGSGTFSLLNFYERRVRRILPALLLVMLATAIWGALVFLPSEMQSLSMSQLSIFALVANFHAWRTAGYFGESAVSQPLLHTWSLAVEEQFYLVFPLVLVAATRKFRRYRTSLLVAAGLLSLLVFWWAALTRPNAAYYLAPFRGWEFMAGALLVFARRGMRYQRAVLEALAVLGAGLVAFAFAANLATAVELPLRILCAVTGTALLIGVGSPDNAPTLVTRLLANRMLVALGLISYPLYLWHWPLIVGWHYNMPGRMTLPGGTAIVVLSIALASATYWLIEKPIRSRTLLASRGRLFAGTGTLCAALAAFSVWALGEYGIVRPVSAAVRAKLLQNEAQSAEWAYPASCRSSQASVPLPDGAVQYCTLGKDAEEKVLFWGDSLVEQLYPVVQRAVELGWFGRRQVVFAIASGCQPIPGLERPNYRCAAFNAAVLERARQPDIKAVVVGGAWSFDPRFQWLSGDTEKPRHTSPATPQLFLDAIADRLRGMIVALRSDERRVGLLAPFPTYAVSIPKYMQRQLQNDQPLGVLETRQTIRQKHTPWNALVNTLKTERAIEVFDPAEPICTDGPCTYQRAGVTHYRDANHLTPQGSMLLLNMIRNIAQWSDPANG
ncbi:MAG: acyltransferase family protein [Hyphomicrobiaceae bacterium]